MQVWSVPYPQNPLFTGREAQLTRLRETFLAPRTSSLPQVLSGLGGVGKTQTALAYAYRYRSEYQYVFWLRADTIDLLASDLASLVSPLGLPIREDQDQSLSLVAVKQWLVSHKNWLLVLDNADDFEAVLAFLPRSEGGHMLLTSRPLPAGARLRAFELEKMLEEEAVLFLLRQARLLDLEETLTDLSPAEHDRACKIAEILDYLPLALGQAGGYIDATGCGLAGYIERYQRYSGQLLKDRRGLSDYRDPVATTWTLSFEEIAETNAAATDLLYLCAFLHADAIPEALFTDEKQELTPALASIANDLLAFDDLLVALRKYALLRRNRSTSTLTMHRLVQKVLRDRLDEATRRQWAERAVYAINGVFPDVEFATWEQAKLYLPQAQLSAIWIAEWQLAMPAAIILLDKAGCYLRDLAQYAEAEPLLKQALQVAEQKHEVALLAARVLTNLGELHRLQGKYAPAEACHQQAIAIREQLLDESHPDLALSLNRLARSYQEQARYTEAEPLYRRSLKIREQAFGPKHATVAESFNDLATLYSWQGKYGEALPLYRQAVKICEEVLGERHPDTAGSLNNLAGLYQAQGKYGEALPLYQQAWKIREEVLGERHPETAGSLNNLAALYEAQGKYGEALPLYQQAVRICEEVLGERHPETARSLNNLAGLYQAQGKYIHAEPLYKQALKIREQVLGPKHPDLANSLHHLAVLYTYKNNYNLAEQFYKRAISIYEQTLGPDHPNTAKALASYANLLRMAKRKQRAAEIQRRVDAIRAELRGDIPPD